METHLDLASLIQTHQAGVWRYLRALGCDPSQADDFTQDTFLAVLEKPFEDHGPAATAAYLRKVARNVFLSALRRLNRQVSLERVDEVDRDWARWAGQDSGEAYLDALNRCLESLADKARQAIQLRYREEQSRSEIAARLGMTEDGAKNLMQRTKQTLRECVERKLGT